jgi:hypothetical protein
VLGIILIALSLVIPDLPIGPSGEIMDRVKGGSFLFGGIIVILIASRLGKRERPKEPTQGAMRGKARLVFTLILTSFIIAQFAVLYYMGQQSAPFSIQVTPLHIEDAVAGQSYVFSVTVQEEGEGKRQGEAVNISVFAPDATTSIAPEAILPGEVAEVTVIPMEVTIGRNLSVIIYGKRSRRHKVKATIMVNAP